MTHLEELEHDVLRGVGAVLIEQLVVADAQLRPTKQDKRQQSSLRDGLI